MGRRTEMAYKGESPGKSTQNDKALVWSLLEENQILMAFKQKSPPL